MNSRADLHICYIGPPDIFISISSVLCSLSYWLLRRAQMDHFSQVAWFTLCPLKYLSSNSSNFACNACHDLTIFNLLSVLMFLSEWHISSKIMILKHLCNQTSSDRKIYWQTWLCMPVESIFWCRHNWSASSLEEFYPKFINYLVERASVALVWSQLHQQFIAYLLLVS